MLLQSGHGSYHQSRRDHGGLWSCKTWLPVSADQICSDDGNRYFRQRAEEAQKRKVQRKPDQDFAELSIGDLVVHEKHGLGIYRGIEKVEVDRVVKDYIKIEYRGGSNLYILATQLDVLQKYSGSSENAKTPKLNKLGGQEWNKTKSRVKGAVKISQKSW